MIGFDRTPDSYHAQMNQSIPKRVVPVFLLALMPLAGIGCQSTRVFTPESSGPLSELDWLAGWWQSENDGERSEELWLPPAGSKMPGVHRDVMADGRTLTESLVIVAADNGEIRYVARPGDAPPTAFELQSIDAAAMTAVFTNPHHDFPRRITYRRVGDELHAIVDDGIDPPESSLEWTWTRTQLPR